jgi:hypothetical protein
VVSVLVQGAQSECAPWTRAVKTTSAIPRFAFICGKREERKKNRAAKVTAGLLGGL